MNLETLMRSVGPATKESTAYPSLKDVIDFFLSGQLEKALKGLAQRQDARESILAEQASRAFDFLTDNPRKSISEARMYADQIQVPEVPQAILELVCRSLEKKISQT